MTKGMKNLTKTELIDIILRKDDVYKKLKNDFDNINMRYDELCSDNKELNIAYNKLINQHNILKHRAKNLTYAIIALVLFIVISNLISLFV